MGFQLSAGVNVSEIDLTTIVPAVATTDGALAGDFRWGPADRLRLVDSEDTLVNVFGSPDNATSDTFFTAANFLSYGNKLHIVRTVGALANNAVTGPDSTVVGDGVATVGQQVKNSDSVPIANATFGAWVARYPGVLGNSLKISTCASSAAYGPTTVANSSGSITFTGNSTGGLIASANVHSNTSLTVGDVVVSNGVTAKVLTIDTAGLVITTNLSSTTNINADSATRSWEYANSFDSPPTTSAFVAARSGSADELHVIVVDEDGVVSGVPGAVLEKYAFLSKASDGKNDDGSTSFYKTIIDAQSSYVRYLQPKAAWATIGSTTNWETVSSGTAFGAYALPHTETFDKGTDIASASADILLGYDKFIAAEEVDVSLVLVGGHDGTVANYIIDNICEVRKDCLAVISPTRNSVLTGNAPNADPLGTLSTTNSVLGFRGSATGGLSNKSSSYAVLDSGWKYQFDKYNDLFRWVPLNGDTAGLMVRTDTIRDPWYSPAGFNRGNIKNVVKLAWNPSKAQRDQLYKNGVNPVVSFPGQGTVLYGDKTLLAKPSAFDRINVRRLFIVLEKAIAKAAQFTLFEFNDAFTRAQFRNMIEPFLRDVQGRRGIIDFRVVADETNNTGEVIDRNEFVGDIYVKPARSINFIRLNFVAVRSGVEFSEIVGQF